MMQNKRFSFSLNVWLTLGIFAICTVAFFAYAWSEKQIGRANDMRHQSSILANELRQSSDDLTIMATSYVVTGNPIYKKYYQDILDIRDGKKPRPVGYQNMYWDMVVAHGSPPRLGGEQRISLLDLMRRLGLTEREFSKLKLAKENSDRLTVTEYAAMKLIEAPVPVSERSHALARIMLHDVKYHQSKAETIKLINEFNALMERRTFEIIHAAKSMALILRVVFIGFWLCLMLMLLRTNRVLRRIMGGSVDQVYAYIARIGNGDFSIKLMLAEDRRNSVLGWLEKAQSNLKKIDRELMQAKKRDQFHRQTLELLAGRGSLREILYSLVLGVEKFNPAMLCSVYMLDKTGRRLINGVAPGLPDFFIAATEKVEIGAGVGVCGKAAFTGQRVIVEDINHHPYCAQYKELAARAGLGSCWSEPIFSSSGQVLGIFSIYHREVHTPAESDIALIEELSRQASIAIERSLDAEKIRDSEAHYRLLTEDVSDVVWKQDREHCYTYISPADERMRGYRADEVIGRHAFELMTEEGAASARETSETFPSADHNGTLSESVVTQLCCKDGRTIWAEIISTPEFDEQGEIVGYHGISRDVTERKQLEQSLSSMSEEFQRSIGRELHDNLGQIVSAIAYQATAMQNKLATRLNEQDLAADIAFIAEHARKAISECKKLAHGLVPFELESSGLLVALMEYAAGISFAHNLACEFVCHNEVEVGDANLELNIFRIVQEAVNNAVRHSGARHVTITLSLIKDILCISIRDDGSGFSDFDMQRAASHGMGLKFMQYRSELIRGTLKFNFPAAGGTEVRLERKGAYE